MDTITLKLPEELHSALKAVSARRGVSKSEVVREALERSLLDHGAGAAAAEAWVTRWRGRLDLPDSVAVERTDPRLAHLLTKHVR